jgi:FixJ family two-component response regulator
VVFLTGYADVSAGVRAMKAGALDFLTKPVQREALSEAVQLSDHVLQISGLILGLCCGGNEG